MTVKLLVTAALAFLAAVGCGLTSRDPASGSGGSGGTGGSAAAPSIECAGKHWTRLGVPPGESPRQGHGAAPWRADQILVWGGYGWGSGDGAPPEARATGWRVHSSGAMTALPLADAPSARHGHTLDVLGDRLLVFGGAGWDSPPLGDGAWLDLEAGVWSPLPGPGTLLPPRYFALSGAASGRWLVWGGLAPETGVLSDGALYDPALDSWVPVGEPAPMPTSLSEPRALARAGPDVGPAVFGFDKSAKLAGYGYDPAIEGWWEMPSENAPSPRGGASLTWSPATSEFIAWGGYDDTGARADGARFSTVTGTWKPMTTADAPSPRYSHYAAMLGTKLVVWGGREKVLAVATGGVYNLATDTWGPLPTDECAPPALSGATFTAFGDGKRALLWGGVPEPQSYDQPGTDHGWLLEL